jgi:prepilin-type N-terminal cleavage/methylation domain-containing protein
MSARRTQKRGRAGFTLAEVLVATMLLAIVMTAVYTLFSSVITSWRIAESGFDVHQEARNFLSLFTRECGNITARAAHLFEGKDDTLTLFVVSEPINLEEGEGRRLMRVEYTYSRTKGVVEREEAFIEAPLPNVPPEDRPVDRGRIKTGKKFEADVAENVTRFGLRYIWIPAPPERDPKLPPEPQEPIIVERHEEKWGLPQAIEVTIETADPQLKDSEPYALRARIPIRTANQRRSREDLMKMLGTAE